MNIKNGKSKISAITFVILLTISAILVALPVSIAQEPKRMNPYPYINAMPNPVTVNTPTLFHVGSIYALYPPQPGYYGLTVEITKPDDTTEILPPVTTDQTGGTGVQYTPTMVGTYTVRTHFPEQATECRSGQIGPIGTIMEEAYSDPVELIVIEEQIEYYPGRSLPEEYWTRPIDQQIREWYTIAANHLGYVPPTNTNPHSIVCPYNDYAPESAHVLWTKPLTMGGLAGGEMGEHGFEQGDAYVGKWGGGGLFGQAGPVIIGGVLFYNQFEANGGSNVEQWVNAVDLHTGEMLWSRPLTTPDGTVLRLAFGQTFYWDSYNYHGVFDFLWATSGGFDFTTFTFLPTSWHAFDPFTGRWVYCMEGMPSGITVYGPKGEIFLYNVNTNAGTMTLWNSSRVVSNAGSWDPQGQTYNASRGIEWTVDIPELVDLPGSVRIIREGLILGTDFTRSGPAPDPAHMWAISVDLKQGTAEYMWDITWVPPTPTIHIEDASIEEDLILASTNEARTNYGFRLSTGDLIWGPTESRHYTDNWGFSSSNSWDIIADGKVIAGNYGGIVWCYNAQTGVVEWTFEIDDPYTEVLHNNRWRFRPVIVADGKLYIENTEHNPRDPQPRGAPFICIDMEDGTEIWRLPYRGSEWGSIPIIGDSIIAMYNNYDQRIYAIGKGASATTVAVAPKVVAKGSSVVIEGTVMDVSPGTEDAALQIRFPNGVPAVSDADMTDWMLYVYNQFKRPEDATGVEVVFNAVDSDGHWYDIDRTTTDTSGTFSYMWTPEAEGKYTIVATFMGSEGYYASYAETAVGVGPAAEEYPDVPSAEEIAQETISQLPAYPDVPSATQVAQETVNQLPAYPEMPEIPAYLTIDLVIIAAVAIAVIIGIVSYLALKKEK